MPRRHHALGVVPRRHRGSDAAQGRAPFGAAFAAAFAAPKARFYWAMYEASAIFVRVGVD